MSHKVKLAIIVSMVMMALEVTVRAQTDVLITAKQPYIDFGRGLSWGSTGPGNTDNYYLLTPAAPQGQLCVFVANNNPTNAHSFNLSAEYTADQRVRLRSSLSSVESSKWIGIYIQNSPVTVIQSATSMASITYSGAAKLAIRISGSTPAAGTPDTADIFAVQQPVGSPCAVNAPVTDGSCNLYAVANISALGSTKILTGPGSNLTLRLCGVTFATTIAEDVKLVTGTGTNCGTGTVDITGLYKSVTSMSSMFTGGQIKAALGGDVCMYQSAAQPMGITAIYSAW